MKQLFQMLGLALTISQSGLAADAGAILNCRAHVPNGTGLLFEMTDANPDTHPGYNDSFFGGIGEGKVTVTPVHPLKIQYPTDFAATSAPTMRHNLNVSQANEGRFVFSATALFHGIEDEFTATIRYGRRDLVYKATCQFR